MKRAVLGLRPLVHRHAHADVDRAEAPHRRRRRGAQRRQGGNHAVQQRQGNRRADAAQHRPPREMLSRDDHQLALLI
jgi:hypothetical protein